MLSLTFRSVGSLLTEFEKIVRNMITAIILLSVIWNHVMPVIGTDMEKSIESKRASHVIDYVTAQLSDNISSTEPILRLQSKDKLFTDGESNNIEDGGNVTTTEVIYIFHEITRRRDVCDKCSIGQSLCEKDFGCDVSCTIQFCNECLEEYCGGPRQMEAKENKKKEKFVSPAVMYLVVIIIMFFYIITIIGIKSLRHRRELRQGLQRQSLSGRILELLRVNNGARTSAGVCRSFVVQLNFDLNNRRGPPPAYYDGYLNDDCESPPPLYEEGNIQIEFLD